MRVTFRKQVEPEQLTGNERYRRGDQADLIASKATVLIQQAKCVLGWVDIKTIAPIASDLPFMTFDDLKNLGKHFECYERKDNKASLIDKLAPILRDTDDLILLPGEPQAIDGSESA